jgi:hypothetical protein
VVNSFFVAFFLFVINSAPGQNTEYHKHAEWRRCRTASWFSWVRTVTCNCGMCAEPCRLPETAALSVGFAGSAENEQWWATRFTWPHPSACSIWILTVFVLVFGLCLTAGHRPNAWYEAFTLANIQGRIPATESFFLCTGVTGPYIWICQMYSLFKRFDETNRITYSGL